MANAWMIKPLPMPSVTASTEDAGHPAALVSNDYAGMVWKASANSYRALTIDLGEDQSVDIVMSCGLTNRASGSTGVVIYGKAAAASDWTFIAGAPLFASGTGLGFGLYVFPAAVTVRYLLIEFPSNWDGALELSRLVVGKRIQLERNFGFGAAFGVKDLGSVDFNRRGVMSRTFGKKMRTLGLTFSNVRKDEVEAVTKPLLEQVGNTTMIAVVTDPSANEQRRNRCYFGPLVGDLSQVWRNAVAFEAKINLLSIF